jgi:hypothetical protein
MLVYLHPRPRAFPPTGLYRYHIHHVEQMTLVPFTRISLEFALYKKLISLSHPYTTSRPHNQETA